MSAPAPTPQPYVGPRPFDLAERGLFFGRERETEDLFHSLLAQRLVLLHSPSGAGKSSLINAALLPLLEREQFMIYPSIRLGDVRALDFSGNRFVTATLLALALQPPAVAKATPTLVELLDARPRDPGDPVEELLIFDQFEEVLTVDPADRTTKEAFFRELGEALEDPRRWALFAMREEYLGALRPYAELLPTRLSALFRLDLLGAPQAIEAIQGPARSFGVNFAPEAAEKLVADLGRINVERPEGGSQEALGEYVEPVQLQVVCRRLWEQLYGRELPPANASITLAQLGNVGDVNSVLADYYEAEVRAAAQLSAVSERAIRDWFDRELITTDNRRGQVLRVPEQSGGLKDATIKALIDAHLVRSEERRRSTWYELAHDRLIAPIRDSNAAWRRITLNAFQQAALLWDDEGRQDGRLLRGEALIAAQDWATAHPEALTSNEQAFLEACSIEQSNLAREARANWRTRQARVLAVVLLFLAAIFGLAAAYAWQRALNEARNALVGRLAAETLAVRVREPQLSLLTAVEAVLRAQPEDQAAPSAEASLRDILATVAGTPLRAHTSGIAAVAYSPDGQWIATVSGDTTVRIWPTDALDAPAITLRGHGDSVLTLAFSADSSLLASAGQDATVRVWRLDALDLAPLLLPGHTQAVVTLAFHPTRPLLLSGSSDDTALLWDLSTSAPTPIKLAGISGDLAEVAFSPDGRWLGVAADGPPRVWATAPPGDPPITLSGQPGPVTAIAFSDNGLVATGGVDGAARLWSLEQPAAPPVVFAGQTQTVNHVSFSRDGQTLFTASLDGTVRIWNVQRPEQPLNDLRGHNGPIRAVVLSPDDIWLATASEDQTAHLWRIDGATEPLVLRGHAGPLNGLAFSPDSRRLVTVSDDGDARLWWVGSSSASPDLLVGAPPGVALSKAIYSPNGAWVATASFDGTAHLWRTADPTGVPFVLSHNGWVYALAFSQDSDLLATGSDGALRLYAVATPDAAPVEYAAQGAVTALAFSPDRRWLAAAVPRAAILLWPADRLAEQPQALPESGAASELLFSADGSLLAAWGDNSFQLWDLQAPGGPQRLPEGPQGPVSAVAVAQGQRLAIATPEGGVQLWNLAALGAPAATLPGQSDRVLALAFDHAGRRLASGSADGTVRIWDVAAPEREPIRLQRHSDAVNAVAFSPDDGWLATASSDDTGRLYNLAAPGRVPITLRGHSADLFAVSFSADSSTLLTGANDGTARLWHVQLDELIGLACRTAGRNMTLAEWRELFGDQEPYRRTCLDYGRDQAFFAELLNSGPLDEALQAYSEEQQADASLPPPSLWLLQATISFVEQGERIQAQQAFAQAQKLDTNLVAVDAPTFDELCRAGWAQNMLELALEGCNRAVAINPRYGNFRYNRAFVLAPLGQYAQAAEDLQAFLAWGRGYPDFERLEPQVRGWIAELAQGQVPARLMPK